MTTTAMRALVRGLCAVACMSLAHAQPVSAPKSWATCAACHAAPGAAAIGPSLNGVVGRKSGSLPGFGYSRAMKNANIVWDEASLSEFIRDPQRKVPGNRMPFAGISDQGEVAELVNYLKMQ